MKKKDKVNYDVQNQEGEVVKKKKGVPVDRYCQFCGGPMPNTLTEKAAFCSGDCCNKWFLKTHDIENRIGG